jgi:hypothetical protein
LIQDEFVTLTPVDQISWDFFFAGLIPKPRAFARAWGGPARGGDGSPVGIWDGKAFLKQKTAPKERWYGWIIIQKIFPWFSFLLEPVLTHPREVVVHPTMVDKHLNPSEPPGTMGLPSFAPQWLICG